MKISKINQLTGKDLSHMSEAELRDVAKSLAFQANKMIKRLEGENLLSSSLSYNARKSKGKGTSFFKTKSTIKWKVKPLKKNPKRAYSKREIERNEAKLRALARAKKNELIERIASMKAFIASPGATPEGALETKKSLSNDIGKEWDNLTDSQKNKYWEIYDNLMAEYPDIFNRDETGDAYLKLREKVFEMMLIGTKRLRNEDAVKKMFDEWVSTGTYTKPKRMSSKEYEKIDDYFVTQKEWPLK